MSNGTSDDDQEVHVHTILRILTIAGGALVAVSANSGYAAELNPAVVGVIKFDQLKWRDPTGQADVNQAVVQGDPTNILVATTSPPYRGEGRV